MLDVSSNCLVAELGDEISLPRMLRSFWNHAVEGPLQGRERHNVDLLGFHFGNIAQRLE